MNNKFLAIMTLGFVGLLSLGIASQISTAWFSAESAGKDLGYKIGFSLPAALLAVACLWLLRKAWQLWNTPQE